MAINLATQYRGKTSGTNANYPYGQGRNITTSGDGTGTPFEAAWFNDVQGFLQAILTAGRIVPNGTPDNARSSQYLTALRALFLDESSNLSDLTSNTTARRNLGLGSAATRNTGTSNGQVPLLSASVGIISGFVSNTQGSSITLSIGIRIQYGVFNASGAGTKTLPQSFGDTSYTAVGVNNIQRRDRHNFTVLTKRTNNFSYDDEERGSRVDWIAIGASPS